MLDILEVLISRSFNINFLYIWILVVAGDVDMACPASSVVLSGPLLGKGSVAKIKKKQL